MPFQYCGILRLFLKTTLVFRVLLGRRLRWKTAPTGRGILTFADAPGACGAGEPGRGRAPLGREGSAPFLLGRARGTHLSASWPLEPFWVGLLGLATGLLVIVD